MRNVDEQSQAKIQEITTTAQRISKPHDEAKNYHLRSISQRPFAHTTGIKSQYLIEIMLQKTTNQLAGDHL